MKQLQTIAAMMQRLRADPPNRLLGKAVTVEDLLPDNDVLRLSWPDGRVVIRPSGTEPKLKAYLEVIVPDGDAARAGELLAQLRGQVSAALA